MCVFWQLDLAGCPQSSNSNLNALTWYQHTPGINSVLGTAWITYWSAYFYTQSHIHLCTVCPLLLKSLSVEQANKIPLEMMNLSFVFCVFDTKRTSCFPIKLAPEPPGDSVTGWVFKPWHVSTCVCCRYSNPSWQQCKISIFKNHTEENSNAKTSGHKLGDLIGFNCSSAEVNNIRFH